MSIAGSPPARIEIFLRDSSYFTHALFLPRFRHRLWVGLGDLSFTELSTELQSDNRCCFSGIVSFSLFIHRRREERYCTNHSS